MGVLGVFRLFCDRGLRVAFGALAASPEQAAAAARLFGLFLLRFREGPDLSLGLGLGLNIVRETVESQGGRAWAEQPAEGGSIFAIALPLRRGPDTGTHRIPETTAAGDPRHKSIDQPIRDGA